MENSGKPDLRLIVGRSMLWEKDLWRQPGRVGLAIRALQLMVDSEGEEAKDRREAEMLISKLYSASKKPKAN
ncbi:MAG TPA: hypothetical protein VHE09_02020 [Rhizomicrobium sp.]|nr:hypothetical protein [Rhizomicrobium sp.]